MSMVATGIVETLMSQVNNQIVINEFSIPSTAWVTNTDTSTSGAFPKIAVIESDKYTDESTPLWDIISSTNESGIPSSTENDSANMIARALFADEGITLYATDTPTVALKLRVKGV